MTETLWLAGLLFANLWGAGSLNVNNMDQSEPGVAAPPPGVVIVDPGSPAPIRHCEETPILSQIPYVNRLFGTVGYSIDSTGTVEPPIKAGEKAYCEEPPTKEEILAALPSLARGIPYVYEQYREEVEFTIEKLVDRVDDPRFFPLIGPAQLHHCHWKCIIYYTDVVEAAHPFPFKSRTKHKEVLYIDKDHLHLFDEQKDDGAAETSEPPLNCPGGHYRMPTAPTRECNEARRIGPAKEPREASRQTMSSDDVVKMWKAGVSQKIIRRQMELTNAVFNLTADDIAALSEQGVSKRLISAMQERRAEAEKLVSPPPLTKYSTAGYPDQAFDKPAEPQGEKAERRRVTQVTPYWHDGLQFSHDTAHGGKWLPGLLGHIWLINESKEKIEADGSLHVEMYDLTSGTPIKLSECRFDAETLKTLKRTDGGTGYALFLPWEDYRPEITRVEVRVVYMPENEGRPQHAEPQVIRLRTAETPSLQQVEYQK